MAETKTTTRRKRAPKQPEPVETPAVDPYRCSVEGCDRGATDLGVCSRHTRRRNG